MSTKPNWISSYIFHDTNFEEIISELIHPLISDLKSKNLINQYFFIRYWEGGPHIRLRVTYQKEEDVKKIKEKITNNTNKFFTQEKYRESKYSLEYNDYIPEYDRYGGKQLMSVVEQHFQDSSQNILSIIKENSLTWNYTHAMTHAIQMNVILVKTLLGSVEEALRFYNLIFSNWVYYSIRLEPEGKVTEEKVTKIKSQFFSSFEAQKETISQLVKILWEGNLEDKSLDRWKLQCNQFKKHIDKTIINMDGSQKEVLNKKIAYNFEDRPSVSYDNNLLFVYDSCVHMTNNRLGIYLRDESFIAFLIYHALSELKKE